MFPFCMESIWSLLPQLLVLLAGSVAVVLHVTGAHH